MRQNNQLNQIIQPVQWITCIGPLLLFLTFLVSILKSSPQQAYLALGIIIALPICWFWRIKALLLCLVGFIWLFLFSLADVLPDDRIWYMGFSAALAVGLIITTLTFDEIDSNSQIAKERQEDENCVPNEIMEELKTLREAKARYVQLNDQFEEKRKVLNNTRAELFHLEVKHLALQKELEEKNRYSLNPTEEGLLKIIMELEDECKRLETEVESLQEIVTVQQSR